MSRIGNAPVTLPANTTVTQDGMKVRVQGAKGTLEVALHHGISVSVEGSVVTVLNRNNSKDAKALHGTTRALVANAVTGVSQGWDKSLEMVGVGYRAATSGKELTLTVGFSHPVVIKAPEGIQFQVAENTIKVMGINKKDVGELAAIIRAVRKPEPYKGKGIRYVGEHVRKKAGKSAKAVGVGAGTAGGK